VFFLPILIGCPATSAVRRCWLQCALLRANLAGGGDGPRVLPRNRCVLVFVDGNAPHSEAPPNFDGLEYVAMVIRELISAVGFQKLRAKILRQRHPVRPTCAHAQSWSRCSAARALSQLPRLATGQSNGRRAVPLMCTPLGGPWEEPPSRLR
jgi:hypothetical protein